MAGKYTEQWNVPSSDMKRMYVVSKRPDGEFECSCPAWTRARLECRHIREVKMGRYTSRVTGHTSEEEIEEILKSKGIEVPSDPYPTQEDPFEDFPADPDAAPVKKSFLETLAESAPFRFVKEAKL